MKYIIKNCPAFNKYTRQCRGAYSKDIEYQYCPGNESCVTKQIVEEIKEEIKPICQIPDGYCGMKNIYSDSKEFAEKLLSYLEIEECK